MKNIPHIFLADIELHGILTFSSEIRPAVAGVGAVHITSPFIHNYPLIYALNRMIAESYVVIPSLHLNIRRKRKLKPLQYTFINGILKEIQYGNLRHIYSYPAFPIEVTTRKFFLSAKGIGYAEKIKSQVKVFYPSETNWISLVPVTRHKTLIISPHYLPKKMYIRYGMKRTGIAKVTLREIDLSKVKKREGLNWSNIIVNIYDTRFFGYGIEEYIKVLETRSNPIDKKNANVIGYVRAYGLYEIDTYGSKYLVPLPKTLFDTENKK